MNLLIRHWSYDPFLIIALAVALVHERGVHRLNSRAPKSRRRLRRRRSLWFYIGLVILLVAVESPLDYWADKYFWVHMTQHMLLLFAAPVPIIAASPWLPLQHGIPSGIRRPVSRWLVRSRSAAPLRTAGGWLRSPWTAVVGFNADVVFWHLPRAFDLSETNGTVHIWLMHGSFFLFGMLFWLQLVPSHPIRMRLEPAGQMKAIFATATVLWMLAMAMSLFSTSSWYPWYQLHEGPALSPFADQQIGAGIMWTCGTVWAVPAMIVAGTRLFDHGGVGFEAALDALLSDRRSRGRRVHADMERRLAGGHQAESLPEGQMRPAPAGRRTAKAVEW